MVKKIHKLLIPVLGLMIIAMAGNAYGQEGPPPSMVDFTKKASSKQSSADKAEDNDVSTSLTVDDKNAFFDSKAGYTFEVKNNTTSVQTGKVGYTVTTEAGKVLKTDSVKVTIGKKNSGKYHFEIPQSKPGFYKVNFTVNVTDYDDTTRRVFGIRPPEIQSAYKRPADFDAFWQTAKDELGQVKPNFKATLMPKLGTKNRHVYLIEMQSLGNITVRGWMTVPFTKDKSRKYSALIFLPGYQVDLNPLIGIDDDVATITLNVRGQGNSRDMINTPKDQYIFYHIEDKNKYIMRGVIMDCLRCVDFVFSRPELKHDNILVSGGSMGGFLAIAAASLDKRIQLCSAQNPILSDNRNLEGEVKWPINVFNQYIAIQPGLTMEKIMSNMDYYDAKNFATNLTCSTLLGIGLLDPFAPPNNEYAVYNNINAKKRIVVFRDLGHEVNESYKILEGRWLRDAFALF